MVEKQGDASNKCFFKAPDKLESVRCPVLKISSQQLATIVKMQIANATFDSVAAVLNVTKAVVCFSLVSMATSAFNFFLLGRKPFAKVLSQLLLKAHLT